MRNIRTVLSSPLKLKNYLIFIKALKYLQNPFNFILRYVSLKGSYPYEVKLTYPKKFNIILFQPQDLFTLAEIFFWDIYKTNKINSFLDIGGNIGLASLYLSLNNPNSKGLMVEPLKQNIKKAKLNLQHFKNVKLINKAVSNKNGYLKIGVEKTGRYSGIDCINPDYEKSFPSISIDLLIKTALNKFKKIDLIKIDCEGAEKLFIPALNQKNTEKIKIFICEGKKKNFLHLCNLGYKLSTIYEETKGDGVYYFMR